MCTQLLYNLMAAADGSFEQGDVLDTILHKVHSVCWLWLRH